jgi:hypothetical protein
MLFYNTERSESHCAQEKHLPELKEPQWLKTELNIYTLYWYCTATALTTEYSETTAHFNGNFDTDNQIYALQPKCTVTFRMHGTSQKQ